MKVWACVVCVVCVMCDRVCGHVIGGVCSVHMCDVGGSVHTPPPVSSKRLGRHHLLRAVSTPSARISASRYHPQRSQVPRGSDRVQVWGREAQNDNPLCCTQEVSTGDRHVKERHLHREAPLTGWGTLRP